MWETNYPRRRHRAYKEKPPSEASPLGYPPAGERKLHKNECGLGRLPEKPKPLSAEDEERKQAFLKSIR